MRVGTEDGRILRTSSYISPCSLLHRHEDQRLSRFPPSGPITRRLQTVHTHDWKWSIVVALTPVQWKSPRAVAVRVCSLPRELMMMRITRVIALIGILAAAGAVPIIAQVHKFFSPGTVWTVTMIKMAPGMDQTYLEYLDGQFKKGEDAQIKAGFQKSYKILRTMDDGGAWNLLILREYTSLASLEANVEKSDAVLQQTDGTDQAQMKGYEDRSKYREVVGTKYARELVLK